MPRLNRTRLTHGQGISSDSYTDPTFPRDLKYKAWSQKVMEVCTEHKTCYKCRDQIHPGGHTDCPYQHLKRQAWGDFSPLHGKDPEAMQVDEPPGKYIPRTGNEQRSRFTLPPPPGHHQEHPKDFNPYASKNQSAKKPWTKPTRGSGSASAHKRRFSG